MPINLKGIEALMKLRDERLLAVAIGVGVGIVALAIIGYLLHWISA